MDDNLSNKNAPAEILTGNGTSVRSHHYQFNVIKTK